MNLPWARCMVAAALLAFLGSCNSSDSKPDARAGKPADIASLPLSQHHGKLHPALQKLLVSSANSPLRCRTLAYCGNLVKIDCNSAVDGPLSFYDNRDASVVMHCGGACMIRTGQPKVCTSCPPPEWQCREEWQQVERSERTSSYFPLQEQDTAAFPDYGPKVAAAMRGAIGGIRTGCRASGDFDEEAISRMDVGIVVIDANGSVKDAVIFGNDGISCIEDGLKALPLPPPPKAPFHLMFRLQGEARK